MQAVYRCRGDRRKGRKGEERGAGRTENVSRVRVFLQVPVIQPIIHSCVQWRGAGMGNGEGLQALAECWRAAHRVLLSVCPRESRISLLPG